MALQNVEQAATTECRPGVLACSWQMAFCSGVSTFSQYAIHRPDASATCSTVDIDLHNAHYHLSCRASPRTEGQMTKS